VGQAKEPEIESENMELEHDLDSVFLYLNQPKDTIQHSHPMDIVDTKNFDEDESFMFQSVVPNLVIEKKNY